MSLVSTMRDYGKIFLGLILAGIILIVVGLLLARAQQPRAGYIDQLVTAPGSTSK